MKTRTYEVSVTVYLRVEATSKEKAKDVAANSDMGAWTIGDNEFEAEVLE